jgi:hypothetical protein
MEVKQTTVKFEDGKWIVLDKDTVFDVCDKEEDAVRKDQLLIAARKIYDETINSLTVVLQDYTEKTIAFFAEYFGTELFDFRELCETILKARGTAK